MIHILLYFLIYFNHLKKYIRNRCLYNYLQSELLIVDIINFTELMLLLQEMKQVKKECGNYNLPVQQLPNTWDAEEEQMKVKSIREKDKEDENIYKINTEKEEKRFISECKHNIKRHKTDCVTPRQVFWRFSQQAKH